jgi:hypothetical protein
MLILAMVNRRDRDAFQAAIQITVPPEDRVAPCVDRTGDGVQRLPIHRTLAVLEDGEPPADAHFLERQYLDLRRNMDETRFFVVSLPQPGCYPGVMQVRHGEAEEGGKLLFTTFAT